MNDFSVLADSLLPLGNPFSPATQESEADAQESLSFPLPLLPLPSDNLSGGCVWLFFSNVRLCIASRFGALVRNSPGNARYMIELKESRNSLGKHYPVVRLNGALLPSREGTGEARKGENPP